MLWEINMLRTEIHQSLNGDPNGQNESIEILIKENVLSFKCEKISTIEMNKIDN